MSDQRRHSAKEQLKATTAILGEDHFDAELPVLVADDFQRRIVEEANASPERSELDCCAGCYFCCSMPVDVSAPEAVRIAKHVREKWSSEEVNDLEKN